MTEVEISEALADLLVRVTAVRGTMDSTRTELEARMARLEQDEEVREGPVVLTWLGLEAAEREAQLQRLREWYRTTFTKVYPGARLDPCWASHAEALWELGNLMVFWEYIFKSSRPPLPDVLAYFDRYAPAVIARLRIVLRDCATGCAVAS